MIKVVQGNDFLLHITLTEESIDIGSADSVKLRLVGFSNSVEIPCEVLSAHEISSRVEGNLPCGTYGVEITGRLVGNDFRSFEVGQIGIVYTNAEADHAPTDVLSIETAEIGMGVGMAIMQIREQSDWAETDTESNAFIKNKPDVYTKKHVDDALAAKVDKESGKGLSEEDYSSAEKAKLGALPTKSELDAELESKVDSTTLDNVLTDYVRGEGHQVFQQPTRPDSTTGSANLDAAFKKQLKKELMKVGFAEVVSDIAFLYEDDTRTNLIAQIPLIAYALKSQTYTKAQVDDIVAAVKQFEYEVVAELPTASAATKGKIYLVPSSNPKTQNVKDEFITTEDNGVFAWEQIGTTTIDLSDYYNKSQVDTKLATKASVSNVYTRTQTDNKLKEKADVSDVEALETDMAGKMAGKADKTGVMFAPVLSTFPDSSKELLFIYYDNRQASGTDTMRVIIPAPADVNKAYVDRQVAAAKPMVVNVIPDEETETGELKADKPFAEVLAWAKAGGTVVLRESYDEDSATEYPLIYHDASMLQFRLAPESTCVFGFDLYEDETLEYIEDYSAQENIDMMGERVDALDNKIFQSETTYSLPMEGAERMNPPYTPFGGGPLTKWATLPAGITLREHILEFSLDDGATWYSQNTSTRAVEVVDRKVYWSVNGSAPTPPPEPSDTLQIKVVGVVEKLQNQIDSLDARVTALENK